MQHLLSPLDLSVEELDNVKGIGPSLIENIRFLVCVEDEQ